MSENNEMDEIYEIIDEMQSRLVELFDQFRELRIRLGQKPITPPHEITPFSSTRPKAVSTEDGAKSEVKTKFTPGEVKSADDSEVVTDSPSPPKMDVRVSRLLDPISHELTTGSSPAEVIAEYLQSAKDELITKETQNNKVARDMDIVLKFLRARGRRGIRTEERDNILRRIKRWKAHLSK